MTNNIPFERALINMDALQNYIESIDSMPSQMRKNFVLELDYVMREIKWYVDDAEERKEYALNQSSTPVEQTNEENDNG